MKKMSIERCRKNVRSKFLSWFVSFVVLDSVARARRAMTWNCRIIETADTRADALQRDNSKASRDNDGQTSCRSRLVAHEIVLIILLPLHTCTFDIQTGSFIFSMSSRFPKSWINFTSNSKTNLFPLEKNKSELQFGITKKILFATNKNANQKRLNNLNFPLIGFCAINIWLIWFKRKAVANVSLNFLSADTTNQWLLCELKKKCAFFIPPLAIIYERLD